MVEVVTASYPLLFEKALSTPGVHVVASHEEAGPNAPEYVGAEQIRPQLKASHDLRATMIIPQEGFYFSCTGSPATTPEGVALSHMYPKDLTQPLSPDTFTGDALYSGSSYYLMKSREEMLLMMELDITGTSEKSYLLTHPDAHEMYGRPLIRSTLEHLEEERLATYGVYSVLYTRLIARVEYMHYLANSPHLL